MAEDILRVIPRGIHDADMFIRPEELKAQLTRLGFQVAPMTGIGPVGVNRRLDFVFGRWPTTAVAYVGHAVRF
jgi:2-polyprenyl-6-hydroxyphenyl methylase/3-demethylubiquinone-9 3-methyltransferase